MAAREISTAKIYDLVNEVRMELKADISNSNNMVVQNQARLENKFDDLEAGRLTRAEADISRLRISQATQTTKLALLGFIAASMVGAIINVLVPRLLR